jgi:hypothetical protein
VKTSLKISVGLNLVLTATAMIIWADWQRDNAHYAQKSEPVMAQPAPTIVTQVVEESTPFRWSQLVSSNGYKGFVASLRASGCPERTVEEIVYGDLEYVFSAKRRQFGIDRSTSGPWSDDSQARLAAYVLGQNLPEIAETPSSPRHQPIEMPLETPLVMQDVDLDALGLSDDQVQAVASVRQDFLSQTDGQNQDTNSPTYHRLWRKAQQAADNALMAQLGYDGFNKYELMAYQSSLLNQK